MFSLWPNFADRGRKNVAVGPGNAVQADTGWLGNLPRGVNNFNKSCFYQIEKFIF